MPDFVPPIVVEALPVLIRGAEATIFYAAGSVAIGFVIAVGVCAMRLSKSPLLFAAGTFYVSLLRGIPLLVQLLISYYCLPLVGVNISPMLSALLTLAVCTAAYMAEILRGGFLGISPGQVEAAQMAGLRGWQILLYIEVPQAVRLTLPSLLNEVVNMVKASSLISVVGVLDLTRAAQNVASSTYQPLPVYLMAGAIYFVITFSVARLGGVLERRLSLQGRR
ncbi:amino acid ABC transporter permease [Afifella sp. YEN Y35]|uniref:amino acid ABC transporter permease n=1 Tax=Afifella sp. YEN Y35 TaxID=3388337 RepID=UPI0039E1D1F0